MLPASSTFNSVLSAVHSLTHSIDNAEGTSEEQRIKLPFPLLDSLGITLASLSIWKSIPLNFSTDHLPDESTSKSNLPALATPV